MDRWVGRVVLVTGVTAGIGTAIARNLVKHGMVVVGCGRRAERLKALSDELKDQKGNLHTIQCDLSKEDEILSMFKTIDTKYGGADVVINNAGLAQAATLLSGKTEDWKTMLDVNVLGLSICTREGFQSMKRRGIDDGHIINISSMSGHRVIASSTGHFYSATKFAVRALSEGVRNELREMKSNIRISSVSPGIVETEFSEVMRGKEAATKFYSSLKALQAEDIADAVDYILAAPPHVQVHDVLIRPTEQKS